MSSKKSEVAARAADWAGRGWDARYLCYFDCFNRQCYYEAHDVLEDLWLERRTGPEGNFYKALIQLAGAFVHLQKGRLEPAAALLRLAEGYLENYPPEFEGVNLPALLHLTRSWRAALESSAFRRNPLGEKPPPQLAFPREVRSL